MDTLCARCNEPWEVHYMHQDIRQEAKSLIEEGDADTMEEAYHQLGFRFGQNHLVIYECPCCDSQPENWVGKEERKEIIDEIAMLMGDDLDGLASQLDSYIRCGMI